MSILLLCTCLSCRNGLESILLSYTITGVGDDSIKHLYSVRIILIFTSQKLI